MFENRNEKQLIMIYAVIAIVISIILAIVHYLQNFHPYYIIIAVNIEFFCIFYILYLPLKIKKSRGKK